MGIFDQYGQPVGGHRYKKFRPPEPLSITILKLVGLGVAFTAASILSPTFLTKAIKAYLKYKIREAEYLAYLDKRRVQKSLRYLRKKNFIAFPADKKKRPLLTKLGLRKFREVEFNSIEIKPVPWDGLWRFLVFDIPERQAGKRYIFRKKLKELGFFHFQRSVFLTPYPCRDEVGKMTEYLEIEESVHLMTANRFPGDENLVTRFNPQFRINRTP